MAQVANTFSTSGAVGIREQLADIIYNISPTDVPFMSGIRKGTASNTYFEWQVDSLAAAGPNAQLEGDDVANFDAVAPTNRIGNRTQIFRKDFLISGTLEAVNKAGRKSEIAYQLTKKAKEIKRDMEFALTQNSTAVVGSSTVARQTRGLEGWISTNVLVGAGGSAPAAATNTAGVDGAQRPFTESLLKSALQACYTAGGNPDTLMVGPFNKQVVSTFTGGRTVMNKAEAEKLYAAIDVYVSDYGTLNVVPNRFQRDRVAFVLEMDLWEADYLRSFETVELAKTGDAEKRMLIAEMGLKANQEAASAQIRDLATS